MKAFEAMFAQRVIAEIASWTFTNVLPYNRWRRLLTPVGKVPTFFLFHSSPFFGLSELSEPFKSAVYQKKHTFKCKICDVTISRKNTLVPHIKYFHEKKINHITVIFVKHILSVHERQKLFKCELCEENFTHESQFNMT